MSTAETKKYRVGITTILDAWDEMVDIVDYAVQQDGSLKITYYGGDDKYVGAIKPDELADKYDGRFVKWEYAQDGSLDAMVIERDVA